MKKTIAKGKDRESVKRELEALAPSLTLSELGWIETSESLAVYTFISSSQEDCVRLSDAATQALGTTFTEGARFIVLALTGESRQLLMKELTGICPLMERVQDYGDVAFDFGIREGLGGKVELMVIEGSHEPLTY